jgi:hypothetical protein
MPDPNKDLIVFAALFLVCTVYAAVLDRHPQWYIPDRTWATVVVGNGLIVAALWALALWGVALQIGHVLLANAVAGTPILVWQFIQGARRNGERAATRHRAP